ncbi:MAG: hypothetical protein QOJ76_1658 [Acidobacteriota bacterium]|jgi:hypothetical protein|nr:hypothetical protein [Acidobacteriota bacterium]
MRLSRAQLAAALALLVVVWLVLAFRLLLNPA